MLNIAYNDIICSFNIASPYGISGTYRKKLQVLTVCEMVETFKLLEEGFALFFKV
jgi:hypothetical protein